MKRTTRVLLALVPALLVFVPPAAAQMQIKTPDASPMIG